MEHVIRVTPSTYERIKAGEQTFVIVEVSLEVQRGDLLTLKEWNSEPVQAADKTVPKGFTGSKDLTFVAGFIAQREIASLLPVPPAKKARTEKA